MADSSNSPKFAGVWNYYAHVLIFGLIYLEWSFSALVARQIPGTITIIAMFCLISPLLIMANRVGFEKGSLLLYFIMAALVLLSCLRDGDWSNNLLLLTVITVGFFIAVFFTPSEFGRVFGNVVLFLAVVSLPVFFLSVLAPGLIDRLPLLAASYMDQTGVQVHSAIFAVGVTHSLSSRNCGIAWEPGAFSILLCAALFLALLFPRKRNTLRVIILIVAELTTLSTMGIAVMCAILLVMFSGKRSARRSVIAAIIAMALLAASAFGLIDDVFNALFSKLDGLFSTSQTIAVTTQDRLNAVIYPLRAFADAPVFGVGYERFIDINVNQCNGVATNTFANWLALMGGIYGIPCSFFYLRAVYKGLKALGTNWLVIVVAISASVLMLSTEDLIRISLVYVFVFYGSRGLLADPTLARCQIGGCDACKRTAAAS